LRADPVMRDANRLHEAEQATIDRQRDADQAAQRWTAAQQRHASERTATQSRNAQVDELDTGVQTCLAESSAIAIDVGLETGHQETCVPLREATADYAEIEKRLRELTDNRREQIALMQRRVRELEQAVNARALAQNERNARAQDLDAAQQAAQEADTALQRAAADLSTAWRLHFANLTALRIADADAVLESLAVWAETLEAENPARAALMQSAQGALRDIAEKRAALKQLLEANRSEIQILETERERLVAGEDRRPPVPPTRDAESRTQRAGAPLWQLFDFIKDFSMAQKAGLEAALEASGLLDAWLTPEGVVLDPATQDVWLVPRARQIHSLANWLIPAANDQVSAETIQQVLASIACGEVEDTQAEAWVAPDGRFRLGPVRGAWSKPAAEYIGFAAREAARQRRLEEIATRLAELSEQAVRHKQALADLQERQTAIETAQRQAPTDDALRSAHAAFATAEKQRRVAQTRVAEADLRLQQAEHLWARARDALEFDAQDLRLPLTAEALALVSQRLGDYRDAVKDLLHAARNLGLARRELADQIAREQAALALAESLTIESRQHSHSAEAALARRDVLRETVGAAVADLEAKLKAVADAVAQGERELDQARQDLSEAQQQRAKAEQKSEDAAQVLEERTAQRKHAVARLQEFTGTGLLEVAVPDIQFPDLATAWNVDPALTMARRVEQALEQISAEDSDWTRIQNQISHDYTQLGQALTAHHQQVQAETTDYGLIVRIIYGNRPERPDVLERRLDAEIAERRQVLTAREREVLENHLQREVAAQLQRLLQEAQRRVQTINTEIERRPTSTGVRFRLDWQVLPEGETGAPVGLAAARARLLNRAADAWSEEDRRVVGEFLENGIAAERAQDKDGGGSLLEHLSRALDYRRWHRFRVQRYQDSAWRPLSGPASSGERALGLTVPLFAAASSHYASCGSPKAPRLVLLDEAFAGIDDEARAHCMALIREFDLDFVMTSEREWGCYAELPGVAICQLVRREGIDAVYVSRWTWDGRVRQAELDPSRRFPELAEADA
jgi:uncharacterized protein (TIGR02680 family)